MKKNLLPETTGVQTPGEAAASGLSGWTIAGIAAAIGRIGAGVGIGVGSGSSSHKSPAPDPPTAKATIASIINDTGISATDFITNDKTLLINAKVNGTPAQGEVQTRIVEITGAFAGNGDCK